MTIFKTNLELQLNLFESEVDELRCDMTAMSLTQKSLDRLIGRGNVFTFLGRYDEALRDYANALKLDKTDWVIYTKVPKLSNLFLALYIYKMR
ncbi:MAG: tetratricopeptide repeat protein [archaeon]|nr:tetratricopeptide repeat protein [archaeon]